MDIYIKIGLFKTVNLNMPNSLFIAILANQPKKTTIINISSIRITTDLPDMPPAPNSGESSIEKISMIKAKFVLNKATRKIRQERRDIINKLGCKLIPLNACGRMLFTPFIALRKYY